MKPSEACITINGQNLSEGESMTVRVALNAFYLELIQHGLGEDEVGIAVCDGYLQNITTILKVIHEENLYGAN